MSPRAAEPEARVEQISAALAEHGLILRRGFDFKAEDAPPPGPSGASARSVLLVGQAGSAPWPHFKRWCESQPADVPNPLDSWSRSVTGRVAEAFGARAVSPSDQPYLPFQQWAMRAEGLKPSPLGILMHPEYGLWHAYRGALLFDVAMALPAPDEIAHPCDSCAGKPCLNACPVAAYSETSYDYGRCLEHVRSTEGLQCREAGCLDRNACPYGAAYRYPAEVQAFHMKAFSSV